MKNLKIFLRNTNGLFHNSRVVSRSKNDWDPIHSYPYMPVDEHTPPKDEEIVSK